MVWGSGAPLASVTDVMLWPPSNAIDARRLSRLSYDIRGPRGVPSAASAAPPPPPRPPIPVNDGAVCVRAVSESFLKMFWSSCSQRYVRGSGELFL